MSTIKTLIIDVDGVLTTGQFGYTKNGKEFKIFGPHDRDGLNLLHEKYPDINVIFITADHTGFSIVYRRIVTDWGYSPLSLRIVPSIGRYEHIIREFIPDEVCFIGDGYYDVKLLYAAKVGIVPMSGRKEAKMVANYITESKAAEGAVMDACLHLIKLKDDSRA